MELHGKMRYTLEEFKTQIKASTLKVGDELEIYDIAGEAIFEVAEVRKKNIYMVRKYVLPDDYDKTHHELYDFLNNDYLNSLPEELEAIIKKRKGSRIFVPYFNEVYGEDFDCSWADRSKGKQWAIFKKTKGKIRIGGDKFGWARWYWLASPTISDSTHFCGVNASGAPDYTTASKSCGVLPCFKINREAVAE